MSWRKHSVHPVGIKGPSGHNQGHTPKWSGSGRYETKCPDCGKIFANDPHKHPKCPTCPWRG